MKELGRGKTLPQITGKADLEGIGEGYVCRGFSVSYSLQRKGPGHPGRMKEIDQRLRGNLEKEILIGAKGYRCQSSQEGEYFSPATALKGRGIGPRKQGKRTEGRYPVAKQTGNPGLGRGHQKLRKSCTSGQEDVQVSGTAMKGSHPWNQKIDVILLQRNKENNVPLGRAAVKLRISPALEKGTDAEITPYSRLE